MKKVFLALACVAFVASMTSCKKNCVCRDSSDNLLYDYGTTLNKSQCKTANDAALGVYTCEME